MKRFAYPLQAFAALIICGGMAWMIFVLAGLDPTPPTAIDLQARNTQDLSFANMNSTAVALAKDMIVNLVPTSSGPILLPVTGYTSTPVPTSAVTLVAISTSARTPTPFSLFSFLFQPTATKGKPIKDDPAPRPTLTLAPTSTATIGPTQTKPPSPTPLPPSLTPTKAPPTVTSTDVPPPISTNTPEPTFTSEPPAATSVPTSIPTTNPPPSETPPPVVATSEPTTPTP